MEFVVNYPRRPSRWAPPILSTTQGHLNPLTHDVIEGMLAVHAAGPSTGRPRQVYTGRTARAYTPVADR